MSKLNNYKYKLKELEEQIITTRIINNEGCQMCGKIVQQKCIICLLANQTAGYCLDGCHSEKTHKPLWIGAFE